LSVSDVDLLGDELGRLDVGQQSLSGVVVGDELAPGARETDQADGTADRGLGGDAVTAADGDRRPREADSSSNSIVRSSFTAFCFLQKPNHNVVTQIDRRLSRSLKLKF